MKIRILLVLCLISIGANAKMIEFSEPKSPQDIKQDRKEYLTKIYNTEVSRNLIHLAHANWNDEAVEGHTTPEFFENYTSGEFLQYVPWGLLMSFEGVYHFQDTQDGKKLVRAIAAFELKKVDVEIIYQIIGGRYLIDAMVITPIEPNDQTLDQVFC